MYSFSKDFLRMLILCLTNRARQDECQEVLAHVVELYERSLENDDYVAYVVDGTYEVDIDHYRRHNEAIVWISEEYGLNPDLVENIIEDYMSYIDSEGDGMENDF